MENFKSDDHIATPTTNQEATTSLSFKVGEREYDVDSAVKKISNADSHISNLEKEQAEARTRIAELEAKLEQSTKLEDALKQLKPSQETLTPEQPTSAVSKEQLEELVKQQAGSFLQQQEQLKAEQEAQALAAKTFQETKAALVERFGDKTERVMAEKANEMGTTLDHLIQMAKSPVESKLLLASLNTQTPSTDFVPNSSVNLGTSNPNSSRHIESWNKVTSSSISEALAKAGAGFKRTEHQY
jgi:chromosome segregation ATPase